MVESFEDYISEDIIISVLPGGRLPERKSEGAIGYDTYVRAIVDPYEMNDQDPRLRKTIFDFEEVPESPALQEHIVPDPDEENLWAYELHPAESVLIGIGFATQMELPGYYWVAPRSGLASKHRITLGNAPGTVDADYRGEAGVIVKNESNKPFLIQRELRIAQIVFAKGEIVSMKEVPFDQLGETERSAGGFGSTGFKD